MSYKSPSKTTQVASLRSSKAQEKDGGGGDNYEQLEGGEDNVAEEEGKKVEGEKTEAERKAKEKVSVIYFWKLQNQGVGM